MSLQIKALEENVGVPLLIRNKHHVSLTPAGRVYLNEARIILERANEAVKLAQTAAEGISGTITIGFIRGYEQTLLLMISAGMGIAVLPEYCVRYYVQAKNLRIVRLVTDAGIPETMNFEISWKKDNTNPAVLQLLNWIEFRKATE